MMVLAEVTLIDRLVFGAFLGALVILGVAAAIVAFLHERKRSQHIDASRGQIDGFKAYMIRQEERNIAHTKRTEEHYDRTEKLLGEISEKLDHRGGS